MTPFDRIINIAQERGISERRACERAGLDPSTLASARRRGGTLDLATISAFAGAYMIPVAQLLGEEAETAATPSADPAIQRIPLLSIHPSSLNPRRTFDDAAIRDLAASITAQGLLQNLVVRRDAESDPTDMAYWIVAGERRWRALDLMAREARLPIEIRDYGVPCRVIDTTDADHLAIALLENLQRQDVNPAEEAEGFARLQQIDPERWTTRAIAEAVGIGQRAVQQRLALLTRLHAPALDALRRGKISFSQARQLQMAGPEMQARLIKDIAKTPTITAEGLRQQITRDMVPVSRAAFPLDSYVGTIVENPDTGTKYFADKKEFLARQKEAAEDKVDELRPHWSGVKLHARDSFPSSDDEPERPTDRTIGGALIHLDGYEGKISVHEGLMPRRRPEDDPAEAARREADTAECQRRTDETDQLRDRLAKVVAADSGVAMALLLWDKLAPAHVRAIQVDRGDGLPASLINDGPLSKIAGMVSSKSAHSARQELRADVDSDGAWRALTSCATSHAFSTWIAGRICVFWSSNNPRPLHPALLAIARQHNIPVPAYLLPIQADIEDAIDQTETSPCAP